MLLALLLGVGALPAAAFDPNLPSIAVMPFSGSAPDAPTGTLVAGRLAQQLEQTSVVRVVPPGKVGVAPGALAEAEQVREWARRLRVGSVLLGRTFLSDSGQVVEITLLSGHSGGPIAEHRGSFQGPADLERVAGELATALLADLDVEAKADLPTAEAGADLPALGVTASDVAAPAEGKGNGMVFTDSDEPLSIDSDELELIEEDHSRLFIFTHNVRVQQGDIELTTEKLEAFYESGKSQPQRLIATGDVHVTQGERHATCDRAVYEREAGTVVCTGRAELVQRCDRVRGPRIQFDLENERVRVLGGASVVIQPDSAEQQGCLAGGGA